MKLSIVILCWNDLKVISDCVRSIIAGTHSTEFEVIVSDNGSTDGSVEFIRHNFPKVRVIENAANLRFAKGNNVGIHASNGEYVLILNPDTIVHEGSLDRWIEFADRHPKAGGFGCRVLNLDGSYQESARPFPSLRGDLIAALYLRSLAHVSPLFVSDTYTGWKGDTERKVDWQSGCCVMFRAKLLKQLGGFDEQFFYYYEDVDLCHRAWIAGYPIIYSPEVTITHLGGQSTKRAPKVFAVDQYRTQYRYFFKYYGRGGVRWCRRVALTWLISRYLGYGLLQLARPNDNRERRLDLYRLAIQWNWRVDPVEFVRGVTDPVNEQNVELQRLG
jgi:GT2 family glycosyltransferase